MNIADAARLVKYAILSDISPILWGAPGIGKSEIVKQIAEELNYLLIDLRLPQLEPADLRGIPMPDRESGISKWYPPSFLPRDNNSKGILFLDEIEKASISVKNASLQLILDKKLGEYQLPKNWRIVCASNREEDGCFSAPLGAALCNRLMHIDVEPDVETWSVWAKNNNISDAILGFLNFRPELLHKYSTGENAFPSPRTWAMANKLLLSIESLNDQHSVLSAVVGKVAAQEYSGWYNHYRNVNVKEILLSGEMPADINEKDASVRYAIALAVANYIKTVGTKGIIKNIAKFVKILHPELLILFIKQLPSNITFELLDDDGFKEVAYKILEVIRNIR